MSDRLYSPTQTQQLPAVAGAAHSTYAVFRRQETGLAVEVAAVMLRPWLDGVCPQWSGRGTGKTPKQQTRLCAIGRSDPAEPATCGTLEFGHQLSETLGEIRWAVGGAVAANPSAARDVVEHQTACRAGCDARSVGEQARAADQFVRAGIAPERAQRLRNLVAVSRDGRASVAGARGAQWRQQADETQVLRSFSKLISGASQARVAAPQAATRTMR